MVDVLLQVQALEGRVALDWKGSAAAVARAIQAGFLGKVREQHCTASVLSDIEPQR